MATKTHYGLEQARARLPRIVTDAGSGVSSVITRHGKPCAAVVPMKVLDELRAARKPPVALLALRGSGRGLWGAKAGKAIADLRDEWGAA
jgi:antitoxin (DNA-binding transcriptional repressor) of toxin-antitoxin stability system